MANRFEAPPNPIEKLNLDPRSTGMELAADVIAGKRTVSDVRSFLMSIKHPGLRLKVQFEFRQQLWSKVGTWHGIDNLSSYVKSLKTLQSRFIPAENSENKI